MAVLRCLSCAPRAAHFPAFALFLQSWSRLRSPYREEV